jgi:hypothetical protein
MIPLGENSQFLTELQSKKQLFKVANQARPLYKRVKEPQN